MNNVRRCHHRWNYSCQLLRCTEWCWPRKLHRTETRCTGSAMREISKVMVMVMLLSRISIGLLVKWEWWLEKEGREKGKLDNFQLIKICLVCHGKMMDRSCLIGWINDNLCRVAYFPKPHNQVGSGGDVMLPILLNVCSQEQDRCGITHIRQTKVCSIFQVSSQPKADTALITPCSTKELKSISLMNEVTEWLMVVFIPGWALRFISSF